ncbi:kinase-like protein [Mytilinidion resinicola]|uniref:non-specific serine/threonine protein kinase n=1 Tax=Mytilinidion resinicola TaxID=574789 RepID=A0A6A6Z5L5_9PEZI|nr:kinase-like protein [Mytilinidion resinicola]KAF2815953.1 kinase-like protein [Mytilinidion resinicola]
MAQPPNVPNGRTLNSHELAAYNDLPVAEQSGYLLFAADVIARAKPYPNTRGRVARTLFERGKHSLKLINKWNALNDDADGKGAWIPGWAAARAAEASRAQRLAMAGAVEEEERLRGGRAAEREERRRAGVASPVRETLGEYVSDDEEGGGVGGEGVVEERLPQESGVGEEQLQAMVDATRDEERLRVTREGVAGPGQPLLPGYEDESGAYVDVVGGGNAVVGNRSVEERLGRVIEEGEIDEGEIDEGEIEEGEVEEGEEPYEEPESPPSPTANETLAGRRALGMGDWQYVMALDTRHIKTGISQERSATKSVLVWVLCDKVTGVIIDRVVVKRLDYSSPDATLSAKLERSMRHEIEMHLLVEGPGCKNILKMRGEGFREETEVGMMYLDYAAGIDLEHMIKLHYQNREPVPEAYLWFVFDGLADALMSITTGVCPEKAADSSLPGADMLEWDPVYHLDIKPSNIFLGEPINPYGAYLTPLLADFGLVWTESKLVARKRKNALHNIGTRGYQPPEQYRELTAEEDYDPKGFEVGPKADIYSLGVTMWRFMLATCDPDELWNIHDPDGDIFDWDDPDRRQLPIDPPGYWGMYSNRLTQLVYDCLKMYPPHRVDNKDLKRRTAEGFAWFQETFREVKLSIEQWDNGESLPWGFQPFIIDDPFKKGSVPPGKRRRIDDSGVAQGDADSGAQ